jgi:hypothetical protein
LMELSQRADSLLFLRTQNLAVGNEVLVQYLRTSLPFAEAVRELALKTDNADGGEEFVHMRRSSIDVAIRHGYLSPFAQVTSVFGLINKKSMTSAVLGLARPEWNSQFHAYHVSGAIEAIDWLRPKLEPRSI